MPMEYLRDNAQQMENALQTRGSVSGGAGGGALTEALSASRITDAAINKFFGDLPTDNPTSEKIEAEKMEAAMDAAVAAAAAVGEAQEAAASRAGCAGKGEEVKGRSEAPQESAFLLASSMAFSSSMYAGHADMDVGEGSAHIHGAGASDGAEGGGRHGKGVKMMTPLPTVAVAHSTPVANEGEGDDVEGTPPADTTHASTMPTPLTIPRRRTKERMHAEDGGGVERVGMGEARGGKTLNLNPELQPAGDQIFAAGTRYSKRKQEQVRDETPGEEQEGKEADGGSRRSPRKRGKGREGVGGASSPSSKTLAVA
jgi:hypothetical protein